MWRALTVLHGDVVCFLDADSERFGPHFACGLVGAAASCEPGVRFVKALLPAPVPGGRASSCRTAAAA